MALRRLSPAINKRRRCSATSDESPTCNGQAVVFIAPDGRTVDDTRRSEILVENSDFFFKLHLHSMPLLWGSRRTIAITFGKEKTRMVWLPVDEMKIRLFVPTE